MLEFPVRTLVLLLLSSAMAVSAERDNCFESREGFGPVNTVKTENGESNIRCSEETGAVLWWQDAFEGTGPMHPMLHGARLQKTPPEESSASEQAVIKAIIPTLKLYPVCGTACHNGSYPPLSDNSPRKLVMHMDVVPDASNLQHGKGALWCLDCHHNTQRNSLLDNFGKEIHMDAAPLLCAKCHGNTFTDWSNGIHGKALGEWQSHGKKRWFGCSECHNPHDVVNGESENGFKAISPEQITTKDR
ncbi:hypothetical protein SAMN02745866_01711 [Alteromonadaceae bacterium Bs31]|nr:hypothetical protein SAMN02745866_01711 [Alteromonadaceae bacterium Bs31]